jgi:hypothetical protein
MIQKVTRAPHSANQRACSQHSPWPGARSVLSLRARHRAQKKKEKKETDISFSTELVHTIIMLILLPRMLIFSQIYVNIARTAEDNT